ncbi:MAG: multicopper oxidase domain-containing protein [bacterium]
MIRRLLKLLVFVLAVGTLSLAVAPPSWIPVPWQPIYYSFLGERAYRKAPPSESDSPPEPEPHCPESNPARRDSQTIDGVAVQSAPHCNPDNPHTVAASVKGTNTVDTQTLKKSGLSRDAIVKKNDRDGDGDPDEITITLEVIELNGWSGETVTPVPTYSIAPGLTPGFWVFAPKTRGMATASREDLDANPLLRVPSPSIRVEKGDDVTVKLENTHYLPHTIHLHGADHAFRNAEGQGNDGVPQTSEKPVLPGETCRYSLKPRTTGSMFYHCHVQPRSHIMMGLQGLFVVESDRPDNSLQTINVGAGRVRAPSRGVSGTYDREYDLVFQDVDADLHNLIRNTRDPRLTAKRMNRTNDSTERTAEYYLLNGKSFPYTFREPIVVKQNQTAKLRVLNGGLEDVSLHTHGHKVTQTHSDGVKRPEQARITRDVVDLSAAQREDLKLKAVNNGLNSYGPGIWLLHDHREVAIASDSISPGGNVSAIVYERFLNDTGMPQVLGVNMDKYFTKEFYRGELPIWSFSSDFLPVQSTSPAPGPIFGRGLLFGIGLGLLLVFLWTIWI